MKKISQLIILSFVILSLFLAGCIQSNDTGESSSDLGGFGKKSNAICGNGIQEAGETSENCCLDVECADFFECKELLQGDKTINTCVKQKLEETKEYKNLLEYWEDESMEYNKEFDLINYDYVLTKINQMNRTVTKLSDTFDVTTEKAFVRYRYERREWNVERTKLLESISKEADEDKQKEVFSQVIELDKGELQRLNSFTDEQIEAINEIFDYDIFERRDTLKAQIKEEEDLLELANKEHEIEIDIIDYNPKCYEYSNECFLDYVKLSIKNVGELPLQNPTFDFYIQKGDRVISRDIDEYDYNFDEIPVGYDGVYKATYIGYDNMDSLPEGSYTLKVNLKQGVSTKVITSTTTSISLR